MRRYLKQNTGAGDLLFTVHDGSGGLLYRVTGSGLTIGGIIRVVRENGVEVARIFRVGLSSISTYAVSTDGKERMRVTQNLASRRRPFRLHGPDWHFRGNVLSRSFDIVDMNRSVVMTHGRCWNAADNCFGLEVTREADELLCLCAAIIVDSTAQCGQTVALPVG